MKHYGLAVLGLVAGGSFHSALAENSDWASRLPAPLTDADFNAVDRAEASLGQLLFYDPVLSGNREVACATCHHPAFGTSDGLSLGLGDGGIGLGTNRRVDPDNSPEQRIPRNSQALWNLGALDYRTLFHDGRVEVDPARPSGMRTPLDDEMMTGFASMLSAQTMFPVLSPDEMAGHYSENEISQAVRMGVLTGDGGAWDLIARRVAGIPAYSQSFAEVYPEIAAGRGLSFTDISNAIAAFIEFEFRSDTAPFDAYLRGEDALSPGASEGMELFYGGANCVACHSGPFQTDHSYYAMGAVQLGPGKAARFETHARDEGRFRVTGDPADLYAFRTPALRNVALTAPYGHAGGHSDLAAFLRAHSGGETLESYDRSQATLPEFSAEDWRVLDDDSSRAAIETASAPNHRNPLADNDIQLLIAFLNSLTDPEAVAGRLGVPLTVPSGLIVPQP